MSHRTLGSSLLLASLLLPAGVVAQDEPGGAAPGRTGDEVWAVSDDGQLFAAIDHRGELPDIYELGRDDFPALVKDLRGTNQLYGIGGDLPPDATIRVARIHRREDLPTAGRDGLPIVAYARIGDDDAAWGSQQQITSLPPPCDADATSDAACLDPAVTEALATAFTAAYTPDGRPAPFLLDPAEGQFVSSGVLDEPGTIVSFAGTSTVTTRLRPRPAEGTLVLRGAASITRRFGGRLSAWDATILELPTEPGDVPDISGSGCCGDLEERIAELEATTTSRHRDDRRELTCPPSGHGLVISQFLLDGVGRGVARALGSDDLKGGTTILVSEVIPVDCSAPAEDGGPPDSGPAAALICMDLTTSHQPVTTSRGNRQVTSPSSIRGRGLIATRDFPPAASPSLDLLLGETNGGRPMVVGLEPLDVSGPVPPEEVQPPDVRLWVFETEGGIDSFGRKRIDRLTLTDDLGSVDLTTPARDIFGKAYRVDASESTQGNCPDVDLPELAGEVFPDGFESGDVSAWSTLAP